MAPSTFLTHHLTTTLALLTLLSLASLALAAASIALNLTLLFSLQHTQHGVIDDVTIAPVPHTHPSTQYPYPLAVGVLSALTFVSSVGGVVWVGVKGGRVRAGVREGEAVVARHRREIFIIRWIFAFWTLVWTGLFAYGCWKFSGYNSGCEDDEESRRRCKVRDVEFSNYVVEGFVWCVFSLPFFHRTFSICWLTD